MTQGRTKTRVEFVRLTSPDERSLLAFKCWLRETCQLIHTSWRTYTPASKGKTRNLVTAATHPASACDRSIIRYIRVKTERERQVHLLRARAYIEENVPGALCLPGGDVLTQTIADLSNANDTLRQMLQITFEVGRSKQSKRRRDADEWRPTRQNVAETVMGTFITLSLHPSALAATAHHLSDGLPERDGKREHGVRSDHVDDAIYRFARDHFRFRSSDEILGILVRVGREEQIADLLWEKVRATCRPWPASYERVQQLFADGKLLEWAAHLEETTEYPSGAQIDAAYTMLLEMWIRRLKEEQAKVASEVTPKNARQTGLFSRTSSSDASGSP